MSSLKIVVSAIVDVNVSKDDHETRVEQENTLGGAVRDALVARGHAWDDVDVMAETVDSDK